MKLPSITLKRQLSVGSIIVLSGILLSSCGIGVEDNPVPKQTFDVSADKELVRDLPDSIEDKGTLNIAVAVGSAPDVFQDEFGNLVGWEVDVAKAATDKLDLNPEFSEISFDSIIPGLQAQRYDIAFGQIGITNERMKKIDQVATGLGNQAFAAPSDSDTVVPDISALCGMAIGITRGSRQQEFAEAQTKKCTTEGKEPIAIQVYDDGTKANLAMLSGRADVSWSGSTSMNYFVKVSKGKADIVGHHLQPYPLGGALSKDSEFSQSYADAVNALIEDGTYEKIMNKWGIPDSIIDEAVVNPKVKDQ